MTGLIISMFSFILDNQVVSWGNEKDAQSTGLCKKESGHKLKNTLKNIFLQKEKTVHRYGKYNIKKISVNCIG